MPSRRSTPTKSSRRAAPRLTLVRSPKGRKPALAAKKSRPWVEGRGRQGATGAEVEAAPHAGGCAPDRGGPAAG
jgi:hypothetical protein